MKMAALRGARPPSARPEFKYRNDFIGRSISQRTDDGALRCLPLGGRPFSKKNEGKDGEEDARWIRRSRPYLNTVLLNFTHWRSRAEGTRSDGRIRRDKRTDDLLCFSSSFEYEGGG